MAAPSKHLVAVRKRKIRDEDAPPPLPGHWTAPKYTELHELLLPQIQRLEPHNTGHDILRHLANFVEDDSMQYPMRPPYKPPPPPPLPDVRIANPDDPGEMPEMRCTRRTCNGLGVCAWHAGAYRSYFNCTCHTCYEHNRYIDNGGTY